jgi:hypothetical protein
MDVVDAFISRAEGAVDMNFTQRAVLPASLQVQWLACTVRCAC